MFLISWSVSSLLLIVCTAQIYFNKITSDTTVRNVMWWLARGGIRTQAVWTVFQRPTGWATTGFWKAGPKRWASMRLEGIIEMIYTTADAGARTHVATLINRRPTTALWRRCHLTRERRKRVENKRRMKAHLLRLRRELNKGRQGKDWLSQTLRKRQLKNLFPNRKE